MKSKIDLGYVQEEQKSFLEHLKSVEGINYQDATYNVPMWLTLALISELVEVLNASKVHKWWDKTPVDKNHVLEELSDLLSHIGNLANMLDVELVGTLEEIQVTIPETIFIKMVYRFTTLPWSKRHARNALKNNIIPSFVELVYSLGFSLEELEEAYKAKMKKNYLRFQ